MKEIKVIDAEYTILQNLIYAIRISDADVLLEVLEGVQWHQAEGLGEALGKAKIKIENRMHRRRDKLEEQGAKLITKAALLT